MRVPSEIQFSQPWRIHEVLGDFPLEDLWQMPNLVGSGAEFDDLIALVASSDPGSDAAAATKFLWNLRDLLGRWFGLGEIASATDEPPVDSLIHRVPDDLRGSADHIAFTALPFVPLFKTDSEFAAEVANATMHGVMHLSWVQRGSDQFTTQMAVYVRPNGILGRAYMQFIKPFRYAIVYPALERQFVRQWNARPSA